MLSWEANEQMKSPVALLVFAASLLLGQPRDVSVSGESAGFDKVIQSLGLRV